MSNMRKKIRHAFAAMLDKKTNAEDRVYPSRIRHIETDELPLISVWTNDESAEVADVAPRRYKRELTVNVVAYLKDSDRVDDEMDDLITQIENVFDNEDLFSLQNDVEEIFFTGSRTVKQGQEATEETIYAALSYTVVYNTWAGARSDDEEDYLSISADFDEKASTEFDISQP